MCMYHDCCYCCCRSMSSCTSLGMSMEHQCMLVSVLSLLSVLIYCPTKLKFCSPLRRARLDHIYIVYPMLQPPTNLGWTGRCGLLLWATTRETPGWCTSFTACSLGSRKVHSTHTHTAQLTPLVPVGVVLVLCCNESMHGSSAIPRLKPVPTTIPVSIKRIG